MAFVDSAFAPYVRDRRRSAGVAFPLLQCVRRLPGDLHVTDPKRLLPTILLCAFAFALWPSDAAAQRRGRPVRSGGPVVVVRPSSYGGYYGYYDPFFWGYGGWYPDGLYAPSSGADV